MRSFLLIVLLFQTYSTLAQTISNVAGVQQGTNAIVTYDLTGSSAANYFVKLYYSTDGGQTFSNELAQVSGDVKSGVKAGTLKKITWFAEKEVNFLSGPVVFKVEAETRKTLPKPITNGVGTVEITSVKRNDDEVKVDFVVTYLGESEQASVTIDYLDYSQLYSSDGVELKPFSGVFGGKMLKSNLGIYLIKGVSVKGSLLFRPKTQDLVIPAINIVVDLNGSKSYIFKNIPVE